MIRPVFGNTASAKLRCGFVLRGGGWRKVRLRVRCGLIDHPRWGPVLIDAGYGPRATEAPGRSWRLRLYARMVGMVLNPLESPLAMLADHGFLPEDVKLVLLTHLHADHVAYLRDLPEARFVVDDHVAGRLRHGVFEELLPDDFAERCVNIADHATADLPFGMGHGFDVLGDGSALAVRLPGHLAGHYGICFPGETPLLYAADAQWMRDAVLQDRAPGFPASLIAEDRQAMAESVAFARRFVQHGGDLVLCHDPAPTEYDWTPTNV